MLQKTALLYGDHRTDTYLQPLHVRNQQRAGLLVGIIFAIYWMIPYGIGLSHNLAMYRFESFVQLRNVTSVCLQSPVHCDREQIVVASTKAGRPVGVSAQSASKHEKPSVFRNGEAAVGLL